MAVVDLATAPLASATPLGDFVVVDEDEVASREELAGLMGDDDDDEITAVPEAVEVVVGDWESR